MNAHELNDFYAAAFTGGVAVFTTIVVIGFIIAKVFYCISLYKAMKCVPEEKRAFPAWFVWMFFVPLAGIVFEWIMEPFGIPNSFKNALPDNEKAHKDAGVIQGIGLALVICLTALVIPFVSVLAALGALVLWIIYWVKIVKFRREYFEKS